LGKKLFEIHELRWEDDIKACLEEMLVEGHGCDCLRILSQECWCENLNETSGPGKYGKRYNSILIDPTTENPLTVTCKLK
jgi:hypothetical protein